MRRGYAHTHANEYPYCYRDCNGHCNAYSYRNKYGHSHRNSYSYIHAYTNSDSHSGNSDSDANMHTGRDLVRHFERFYYTGG